MITKSVFQDWQEIEDLFPARGAMQAGSFATKAISSRMAKGRLNKMMSNSGASVLAERLDQMDDSRLKALRTYAAVNLEQAASGFRSTIVANVTTPVLVLTIMSQVLSKNWLASIFVLNEEGLIGWVLIGVLVMSLIFLIFVLVFALASLNQARDIRHIIDLQAAERGIYFGLEDAEKLQST